MTNPETFDDMGLPIAKPAIAYTYFETDDIPEVSATVNAEIALAILPGGYLDDPSTSTGVGWVRPSIARIASEAVPSSATNVLVAIFALLAAWSRGEHCPIFAAGTAKKLRATSSYEKK